MEAVLTGIRQPPAASRQTRRASEFAPEGYFSTRPLRRCARHPT